MSERPDVAEARVRRGAAQLLRERLAPPTELTVSEWADEHRVLTSMSSEPGRWRTSRTPYLGDVMDAFSDPMVERVVFMKGAQVGGSEALNNVLGYFIDHDPSPVLFVSTNDGEAANYSKERIGPMIENCAVLREKVSTARSKAGETVDAKSFPGGHLGIVGANSPAGLRSRPRRVLLLDEVDGYPASAGREGDPVDLAVKRTSNFWNRKIGLVSTPTVKGASRIEAAFETSDQRYYHVPCPHCGHEQRLVFSNLRWEKRDTPDGPLSDPDTAHYACEGCDEWIEERHKVRMLEAGRWIADNPGAKAVGFHLSALYSPWFTWSEVAREFLEAKHYPDRLRVFVNTRLGETFEERGEAPEWERLYKRREDYPIGTCPEGVVFLTCGVDVQEDRIEAFVWGWGYDRESWLIEHVIAEGRPAVPETWKPMTKLLHRSYPAGQGELPIAAMAVDTGHDHLSVIDWARRVGDARIMLVKGDPWKNWTVVVGSPTKSEVTIRGRRHGYLLWPVGGALIKQETYGFLRLKEPIDDQPYPVGWVHLPMVGAELVKQLVAEDLVTESDRHGFSVRRWVKRRRRNEALDCRVYARAAAERSGLSWLITQDEPDTEAPRAPERARPEPGRAGAGWLKRRSGRGRRGGGRWLD